jgi:hypothetical protein
MVFMQINQQYIIWFLRDCFSSWIKPQLLEYKLWEGLCVFCQPEYYSLTIMTLPLTLWFIFTETVPVDVDICGGCPGCPILTIKCLFCYCIKVTWRFVSFLMPWGDLVFMFALWKISKTVTNHSIRTICQIYRSHFILWNGKFTVDEKALTLTIVGPRNTHTCQRSLADMLSSGEADRWQFHTAHGCSSGQSRWSLRFEYNR